MTVSVFDDYHSLTIPFHHSPLRMFISKTKYKRGIKKLENFMAPYIQQALAMHPEELEKLSRSDKSCTFLHQIARYSRDPKVVRYAVYQLVGSGYISSTCMVL